MNKNIFFCSIFLFAMIGLACLSFSDNSVKNFVPRKADLKMPPGFSATIIADSLGSLRHLVVTDQGNIYVKLNSLKNGKGIYFLSDTNHDGVLDKKVGFGNYPGTGIKIKNGYLYSASNTGVFRYKLNNKEEVINPDNPETIVRGLVARRQDNTKSIALDDENNLYVTVGSYSDACRQTGSGVGIPGCPLLDSVGGIWEFKADKPNQTYADGIHFAKGIKNAIGIEWNAATKTIFATQHGRGRFDDMFPQNFTPKQSAELPAETLYELHQGADGGWPFIYYDQQQNKKMIAPEYGGDGKTSTDKYLDPIVAFPAHLAPNDLLLYTGNMFPERYKNGAFLAFHAQSPELKKGYLIAFVPFKNGKPSGNWEIFADNFTGIDLAKPTGPIQYRPAGLAQGPDGALYVADDLKGAIFRIVYSGNK